MKRLNACFFLSILCCTPFSQTWAQDHVPIDMSANWLRRDGEECKDPTVARQKDGIFSIRSDHSSALFWQIPTQNGPLPIDRDQSWIRKCKRPPLGYESKIRKQARGVHNLVDVSDYPYLTWRWRVEGTIDDTRTAKKKGKIRKEANDFAAKIGISILSKSGKLREIAYIWTRTIPKETALTQETVVIPIILKFKWYRIVAESGEQNLNTWVPVTRNLYADYKRFYPDEEPGEVARIYLMTDSDNTSSKVAAAYADIVFHRNKP